MKKLIDLDINNQRVLIRQDLNVPIKDGKVANAKRIDASLPTIRHCLEAGAKVMVMSHLGRPTEGQFDEAFSLRPVADYLSQQLGQDVHLERRWLDGVEPAAGSVVLCENVRFNIGEKTDDESLAKRMAGLCEIFVMDAFGTAHRAQASTHGVARFAPTACAGPLLAGELDALSRALEKPQKPMLAIVGGSKVSTKLTVLDALSTIVDQLIVGGGIANTFIAAAGHNVGKSLVEMDLMDEARALMAQAQAAGGEIPVPVDVVVATEFAESAEAITKPVDQVGDNEMILDIGPQTAARYADIIEDAATIVWNGPVGVFEFDQFGGGTRAVAEAVAGSAGFSIAGGGDTVAAVDKYGVADRVSYISTGGGAFLAFLEGKELPAVAMLKTRAGE